MAGKSAMLASLALAWWLPLTAATLEEALTDLTGRLRPQFHRGDAFSLEVRPAGDENAEQVASYFRRTFGRSQPPGAGIPSIAVTLSENLESKLLVAEVRTPERTVYIHPYRPAPAAGAIRLATRLLVSSPERILAAIETGAEDLVVLGQGRITRYGRVNGEWALLSATEFEAPAPMPRDPRGALAVEGGNKVRAWLPGLRCAGGMEPWEVACGPGDSGWPMGLAGDAALEPGRNFFRLPAGEIFNVVFLTGTMVAAHTDGTLRRHANGEPAVVLSRDEGSEIAALETACAGTMLVAASRDGTSLRALRLSGSTLSPIGAAVSMPGEVTALQGNLALIRDRHTGDTVHRIEVACGP